MMRAAFTPYLTLALLCLCLFLPGLLLLPPIDRDEARFAQASKQMVESGDYLTIRYQDTPRYKKPIGIYWLQSLAAKATGAIDSISTYRLPSLLGAIGAVLALYAFARRWMDRRQAWLTGALLASTFLIAIEAQMATVDATLLFATVLAMGALGNAYLGQAMRGNALMFWLALAAGVLLKGPVLPGLVALCVGALGLADRELKWFRALRPLAGFALMLAVAAPWFAYIIWHSQGAFLSESLQKDFFAKLVSEQESHGMWPGFYTSVMPLSLWPASLFVLPSLLYARAHRGERFVRFALAWALPMWLVLELLPTKLPHYVLPLYPALALLAAHGIGARAPQFSGKVAYAWYALIGLLTLGLIGALAGAPQRMPELAGYMLPAALLGILGLFAVLAAVRDAWRGEWMRVAFASIVLAMIFTPFTFARLLPAVPALRVSAEVSAELYRLDLASHPLVAAGYHEPSLVFLTGTHTALLNPAEAAVRFITEPETVAIIEAQKREEFLQTLSKHGVRADARASISGFNYARGEAVALTVYTRHGH